MPRRASEPDSPPAQLSLFDGAPEAPPAGEPAPSEALREPSGASGGAPSLAPRGPSDPGRRAGRPVASAPPLPPQSPQSPRSPAPTIAPTAGDPAFRHPEANREVVLEGHPVAYRLRRARRRSIGFVVGTDGLSVNAPRWVGVGDIEAALREKAGWILRKLGEQRERARRVQAARVDWRDGATLPFLGDTLVIVLDPRTRGAVLQPAGASPAVDDARSLADRPHAAATAPAQAALQGVPHRQLHVGLPQGASPAQIRDAVQAWLQRQARALFEERCRLYAERLGVRYTRLALSSAQTRWGSASTSGAIRLNWRLVHFGLATIDYVVAHELAHLREMNHSPRFWDVVRSVMPDYERAMDRLKHDVLPVFD